MLLNLLNLYSLIFALFSKIEGMSVALNQLKPNATIVPNTTWIYGSVMNNGSCVEEMVSCGPCSIHIILSAIDGTPIENIYTSLNGSETEVLKMYLDTYSSEMTKYLSSNADLEAENLIKYSEKYTEATTMSAANKELLRIKNLLLELISNKNDSISDNELFDIFTSDENYTFTTITTDFTTSTDDYTEISSTDKNYGSIFTESEITDASTTTEDITDKSTPIKDDYSVSSADVTEFTTYTPDITETIETETSSQVSSDGDSNDQTTYLVTSETTDPYTNSPYSTKLSDTTTVSASVSTGTTPRSVTSLDHRKICPDLLVNCTTICGGKNITQVFSITNCSIINRVCYERKCDTHNLTENMTTTNTTVMDIVYEDEKHIKQYNLTVPTRKKLLKLCWETMFGQELIKLTMMDLVIVLLHFLTYTSQVVMSLVFLS